MNYAEQFGTVFGSVSQSRKICNPDWIYRSYVLKLFEFKSSYLVHCRRDGMEAGKNYRGLSVRSPTISHMSLSFSVVSIFVEPREFSRYSDSL